MTDPYYPLWPVVALIVVLAALAVLCVFSYRAAARDRHQDDTLPDGHPLAGPCGLIIVKDGDLL